MFAREIAPFGVFGDNFDIILGRLGSGAFDAFGLVSRRLPGRDEAGQLDAAALHDAEGIAQVAEFINHSSGESVAIDIDHHGTVLDDDFFHHRHGRFTAKSCAAITGNYLDRSFVGMNARIFFIRTIAFGIAIAIVQDHVFGDSGRIISTIHEHGPFVNVGMTREHQVNSARFEYRHDKPAHFDQLLLPVAVV